MIFVYVVYDQSGQNNLNFPDIFNAKPPVNCVALHITNDKTLYVLVRFKTKGAIKL